MSSTKRRWRPGRSSGNGAGTDSTTAVDAAAGSSSMCFTSSTDWLLRILLQLGMLPTVWSSVGAFGLPPPALLVAGGVVVRAGYLVGIGQG
jgi:hypothetical protein